jgi:hypothetical protein
MTILIDKNCEHCDVMFTTKRYLHLKGAGRFCSTSCSSSSKTGKNHNNYKHGAVKNGKRTPELSAWQCMKGRCYNKNDKEYSRYGARGIKVCDRWLDKNMGSANFLKDMGPRPKGIGAGGRSLYSLDRIDNNGDYSPENCRWTDRITQANNIRRNRIVSYLGEEKTVSEWGRQFGIKADSIYERLNRGWSVEEAITKKPDIARNRRDNVWIKYKGESLILADWSKRTGVSGKTINRRIRDYGWSVEDALTKNPKRNPKGFKYLEFEGKSMTQAEWAKETGIKPSVICKRLKRGWSVEDALTMPVGEKRK